jgi:hypothetical protein
LAGCEESPGFAARYLLTVFDYKCPVKKYAIVSRGREMAEIDTGSSAALRMTASRVIGQPYDEKAIQGSLHSVRR